jgi:hypothetical protein
MHRRGWEAHRNRSSGDSRLKIATQKEKKKKHKADGGKMKTGMKTGDEGTYSNVCRSWIEKYDCDVKFWA